MRRKNGKLEYVNPHNRVIKDSNINHQKKSKYYFRVFAESNISISMDAKSKEEALRMMKKIKEGDSARLVFEYEDDWQLGDIREVERMSKLQEDNKKIKELTLSEKDWKLLEDN